MLNTIKLPNRAARRAAASRTRTLIQKRTPFGRVKIEGFDTGFDLDAPWDDRTRYVHFTRGRMDRRTTMTLLNNLIAVETAE